MPTYTYRVRNEQGKRLTGKLEAVSQKAMAEQLTREGYLITSIKETSTASKNGGMLFSLGRVSMADITMLFFQLGNMLEAGIPLLNSLRTTQIQIASRKLKRIISNVATLVEQGTNFSDALAQYPNVFEPLYRSMIRVGETSGNLDQVLKHISEINESTETLRHEVKSALAYPIVLICASIAVIAFMIIWIVPSFSMIFTRAGVPLPLPTRMLYSFSMWVKANYLILFGGIGVFLISLNFLLRIQSLRYQWDSFLLKIPVVGPLISRVEVARWARNVALMIASGVPILKTLEMTGKLTKSLPFQKVLQNAYAQVQGGAQLAETLKKDNVFPPDIVQMVMAGEESGNIDKMLYKGAHFYDQLVARSLKKLTSAIEPIFILFMGCVVGFIMVSVLLPIFDMLKLF
jgi:type IV pilus assembly protein PilC